MVVSSTGTTFGEAATYSCNTGYQLSGSATVTCQETGSWSTPPSCECMYAVIATIIQCVIIYYLYSLLTVICRDLIVPANGMVSYSDPNIPRATDSTGSYSCNTGYTFSGTLTRTCTATGWSELVDGTPECTDSTSAYKATVYI